MSDAWMTNKDFYDIIEGLEEEIKNLESQLAAADDLCEEIESNLSWVENGFPDIDAITEIENKIKKYKTLRAQASSEGRG